MIRSFLLALLCLTVAAAQSGTAAPDSAARLSRLQKTAQDTETAWLTLASDLDTRVARLAPCDPRTTQSIQEVVDASTARLNALAEFQRESTVAASVDTEAARRLLQAERNRISEVPVERTDIADEQVALERLLVNLADAATRQPGLNDALHQLENIGAMIDQRAQFTSQQATSGEGLLAQLNILVAAFEDRESAQRAESAALEAERVRWNTYYTARMSRAELECSITGGQ